MTCGSSPFRRLSSPRCASAPSSWFSSSSALAGAGAFFYAGQLPGPSIQIAKPEKFIGVATPLEVVVDTPGGELSTLEVVFEQNGARALFSLADARRPGRRRRMAPIASV